MKSNVFGGEEYLVYGLAWTTISTYGLYDTKNDIFLPNFDFNSSLILINLGLSYKNAAHISDNLSFYFGLGLGSFMQLQAGFSTKGGFSLRNRYDLPMFFLLDISPYLGLVTISASIEKYFNRPEMNWYFGLGIGFSINNFKGINFWKNGQY